MREGRDDESVFERFFGGFEEGVHGRAGHSLDVFDEDEFGGREAGLLHPEVQFPDSVVRVFGIVGEFDFLVRVVQFYGDGVGFADIVGVVLEVEEVAVSVGSEQLFDECLCVGGFSYAVGSDKEKKLDTGSGLYGIFDVGFEGGDLFVVSVEHDGMISFSIFFSISFISLFSFIVVVILILLLQFEEKSELRFAFYYYQYNWSI